MKCIKPKDELRQHPALVRTWCAIPDGLRELPCNIAVLAHERQQVCALLLGQRGRDVRMFHLAIPHGASVTVFGATGKQLEAKMPETDGVSEGIGVTWGIPREWGITRPLSSRSTIVAGTVITIAGPVLAWSIIASPAAGGSTAPTAALASATALASTTALFVDLGERGRSACSIKVAKQQILLLSPHGHRVDSDR